METRHETLYGVIKQKKKTVYDFVLNYTSEKYDLRYDELGQEFQISLKGKNQWEILETNSFLIELAQSGIALTPAKLEIFLKSHFVSRFNPIEEYFKTLPKWHGEDYIKALASYLPLKEPNLFLYHFKKWLVRTVRCAIEKEYFNKNSAWSWSTLSKIQENLPGAGSFALPLFPNILQRI